MIHHNPEEDNITESNIGGKVLRQGSYALFWTGFAKIATVALSILLFRTIDAESVGLYAIASFIVLLLDRFEGIGVRKAFIYKKGNERINYQNALGVSMVINIIIALFLLLFAPYYSEIVGKPEIINYVRILAIIPILSIFNITSSALTKHLKFGLTRFISSMKGVLYLLIAFILAKYGFGVWSLIIAVLSSNILATIFQYLFSPIKTLIPRFDKKISFEMLKYSFPLVIMGVLGLISGRVQNFLLGKYVSVVAAGYFFFIMDLAATPSHITRTISDLLFPVLSRLKKIKQDEYTLKLSKYLTILTSPIYMLGVVLAPLLIKNVYGEEWIPAIIPFQIILIFLITEPFSQVTTQILMARGKTNVIKNVSIIYTLSLIGLGFYGVIKYGLIGMAIAQTLTGIISFIIGTYWLKKSVGKTFLSSIIKPYIAIFGTGAIIQFLVLPRLNGLTGLIAGIIIGLIIYATLLFILEGMKLIHEFEHVIIRGIKGR